MTKSIPIRVADAVTTEINDAVTAGTFETLGFTARRGSADWDLDFKDADNLQVDVVRRVRSTNKIHSRGYAQYEVPIHVAVRKRFGPQDKDENGRLIQAATDPLEYLLEEIYSLFADARNTIPLDGEATAKWVGKEGTFHWINQARLRKGLFEGFTELTFTLRKESP